MRDEQVEEIEHGLWVVLLADIKGSPGDAYDSRTDEFVGLLVAMEPGKERLLFRARIYKRVQTSDGLISG